MTNQPTISSDSLGPSNIDVAASADKVAAERKRLATLIGRLLARHWLQDQSTAPDAAAQRPSVHGTPGSRKKRR